MNREEVESIVAEVLFSEPKISEADRGRTLASFKANGMPVFDDLFLTEDLLEIEEIINDRLRHKVIVKLDMEDDHCIENLLAGTVDNLLKFVWDNVPEAARAMVTEPVRYREHRRDTEFSVEARSRSRAALTYS